MEMTRRVMTNADKPENHKAPMGQFINLRTYPDSSFKDVAAPNADTLYSTAWLNLSKEPYILHVPNEHGRYYLMPMLSAWTDVFASPGTRTTGTRSRDFAITGPNWKGKLPYGVKQLKSPTNLVWILGRTYSSGTPEDYAVVHAIQLQYKLTPLSFYGKSYKPPLSTVDKSLDMTTPVRDQVNKMSAAEFFNTLAVLMKDNPPSPADAEILAKFKKIGLQPGQRFDLTQHDADFVKGLEEAVKKGQNAIKTKENDFGETKNGWKFSLKLGNYGSDYLQRALVAAAGLGANLPEDAIYPTTKVDHSAKPLNGKENKYVIHFAKGQMPPVNGFWSLTLYDDQFFFSDNRLSRYNLSQRDSLKPNADGSVDIYIQHESPYDNKESNWLPAPKENFILMFRFYWPKKEILDGTWLPPVVQKV